MQDVEIQGSISVIVKECENLNVIANNCAAEFKIGPNVAKRVNVHYCEFPFLIGCGDAHLTIDTYSLHFTGTNVHGFKSLEILEEPNLDKLIKLLLHYRKAKVKDLLRRVLVFELERHPKPYNG